MNNSVTWLSQNITIGIRANLETKEVWFYSPDKFDIGPYQITGDSFRITSGHCNTGTGTIKILSCVDS